MTDECGKTHDQHLAEWRSWCDDCNVCGFGMQDVDQCDRGHPDDGVTWCGACGYDALYNALRPGELNLILQAADDLGVNTDGWSIGQMIRKFGKAPSVAAGMAPAQVVTPFGAVTVARWVADDWAANRYPSEGALRAMAARQAVAS